MNGALGHDTPAARLRASERLRALFVKAPAPAEVELAGRSGFDLVVLDTEHGPDGGSVVADHLRAAAAVGVPALVRVSDGSPSVILQALDAGATGVVVPHVRNAEAAAAIVAAAHYPPRGDRGLALTTRAGGYGTVALSEHLERAARETLVFVQLEDGPAAAAAQEILAVPGVDGVLIGTTDLSIALGRPGEPEAPEVVDAVEAILVGARAAGALVAVVVDTPADAERWAARGANLTVFVATQLVRRAFAAAVGGGSGIAGGSSRRAPFVLLPGMLATATVWDAVAEALAKDHGLSIRVARITFDDTVAEMAETVLASAPDRFALVGHSLGGIVALAIMRRTPERVTRLVLVNTSARPPSAAQRDTWAAQRKRLSAGEFSALCTEFAAVNVTGDGPQAAAHRTVVTDMAAEVGPHAFDRQLAAQSMRPDARPRLAAIGCPTLIVSGERDDVCPPALQDELVTAISGSVTLRLSTGHMTPLESPGPLAAAIAGRPIPEAESCEGWA